MCKQRGRCQQCRSCDDRCLALRLKRGRAATISPRRLLRHSKRDPHCRVKTEPELLIINGGGCFSLSLSLLVRSSRELGTAGISYSLSREPASAPPHQPLAPPSGPSAYGGEAEGRKRRSPSSYRGKGSKLSRPGLESLFGNGSDGGGILASGPDSQRQVQATHTSFNHTIYVFYNKIFSVLCSKTK